MSSGDKRGLQPDSENDAGPSKRSRTPDVPSRNQRYTRDQYTVGWVCALPLEMAAAKVMLDKVHPNPTEQDPEDHNTYLLGDVWGHNVVVACLPAGIYGTTTAATVAKDMRRTFRSIRFGLMVGIGGGIPSESHDIRLGDIVVSQPTAANGGVIQYDRGKSLQEQSFQRTGTLNAPPQVVLSALSRLQAEHLTEDSRVAEFLADLPQKAKKTFSHPGVPDDCLFLAEYPHIKDNPTCEQCDLAQTVKREGRDNTEPVIHYGTIASGNQVIKDAKLRDQLAKELGALCCEMEAAGLQDFPSIVIRGICDYSDSHKNKKWQPYAAVVAAAFTKELLSLMPPSRVLQVDPIPQLVSIASESLDVSKQHLEMSRECLGEQKRTNHILEDRPIDLYVVHEACYDSEDVGSSPRCEANTRVRIQETIKKWANDEEGEPFLWLVGPAGTGKSTLIRSVADSFHTDKRLVAGYFFKRGEQGRNDTNRLFSTLAVQLADAIPSFKNNLRASISNTDKDSIDKKDLKFQFETLIKTPFQDMPPSEVIEAPRIIVLDALDECERPENLPRTLAFISEICNKSTTSGFRVLLTSRPDPRVISAIEPLIQDGKAQRLQLHRVFSEDTKGDIKSYLQTNFMRIKTKANIQQDPWPSAAEMDHLVELSTHPEPLFIYAATLLRFVYDENRLQNPKNQLKIWIKQCEKNQSQLHQMYNPILEQIFALGKDTDFDQQLQFLGALVLTPLPLSLTSLTCLLDLDIDDVNWWLPSLHAVLDVPSDSHKPLRLLHKSFSDFLLSEENPGHDRFKVDARGIHALLAHRCFEFMERKLKRDICDLKKLDVTPQDVNNDLLGRSIPLELQYSCRYWVHHSQASENIDSGKIFTFLLEHFLHWLEVSALLRQTSVVLTALRALHELVKNSCERSSQLLNFLKDATRTVSSFASIVETAPLQTYASLLLFSPLESSVRQRLSHQLLPPLTCVNGVKPNWDAHIQTIEVPKAVTALVFSSNGMFLASVDSAVRLWNASTGTHLVSFEEPGFRPVEITFSPSNQLLAARYFSQTVRIWDLATLTHSQTIERPSSSNIISIAISSDGEFLISATDCGEVHLHHIASGHWLGMRVAGRSMAIPSDNNTSTPPTSWGEVQLWDVTSKLQWVLSRKSGKPYLRRLRHVKRRGRCYELAAISSNLPLIALCIEDDVVLLQNLATAPTKYVLRTGGRMIYSVTFSSNGKILAGACEGVVFLWNTETRKRTSIMKDKCKYYKVAFSSDDQFLVSHSKLRTRIWNITTETYRDLRLGRQDAIAFFSQRQILATASGAAAIKLWDLEYAEQQHDMSSLETRTATPQSFFLLPNDRYFISQRGCHTLQLWDLFTGELLRSSTYAIDISEFQLLHDNKLPSLWSPYSFDSTRQVGDGIQSSMPEQQLNMLRWHVAYSAKGQLAAALYSGNSTSSSTTVQLYDTATGCHTHTLDLTTESKTMAFSPKDLLYDSTGHMITLNHKARIETIAFSPNGQILALSLEDGTIPLWDTKSKTFQSVIRRFDKPSSCTLFFSPNGEVLAGMTNVIVWWDVATGVCQNTIYPGCGPFNSSISPRNLDLLEPASLEDIEPRKSTTWNQGRDPRFRSCAFSSNSVFLGAVHVKDSSSSETFTLYSIKDTSRQQTLCGHSGHAVQIVFSPDSRMVAVASDDRTVRLWHTMTYKYLHTFKVYIDSPEMTRFSQDGSIIAAASKHSSIKLWNTSTGSLLQIIRHNEGSIQELTLLPDEVIVSASAVSSDKCWSTQTFKLTNHSYPLSITSQFLSLEPSPSEVSLDLDESWVTKDVENIILIPPEYRPVKPQARRTGGERWIRRGNILFMASSNGQVICLRLA